MLLRYRCAMGGGRIVILLGATALFAPAPAPAQSKRIIAAQGHWAALQYGPRCEAEARPLPPASVRQPQARAGFSFAKRGAPRGEFHVRLSRLPRAGASVMLTIGTRPFMLVSRGEWAWSRGPQQETAIIAAARGATGMRVESRDARGGRFTDRYLLAGAPTAIDAAAAGCAGKN